MKTMLIINPGSTSTKITIHEGEKGAVKERHVFTIRHTAEELEPFRYKKAVEQEEYRKKIVLQFIEKNKVDLETIDGIAGRGGFVPVPRFQSGVVTINEKMVEDLRHRFVADHPCNLGAILANYFQQEIKRKFDKDVPAVIMDPVVVDEMIDIARPSGLKEIENKSFFHALNQKAVARRFARKIGKNYEDLNLIVAHMGGGVGVSAHRKGKVIDTFNAMNGQGPFSPERTGGLETRQLIDLCFSGKFTYEQLCKMNVGEGGLYSYLGTKDAREVEKRIEAGDREAAMIYEAMAYQIAKGIGNFSSSFREQDGRIDAILLTGGLAYGKMLTDWITERVVKIAPVEIFPGEDEMQALAEGLLGVLEKELVTRSYE